MNKDVMFMERFWLVVTILIILIVTFMGIKEGFDTWLMNYLFAFISGATYLMRRFMRKRMEKNQTVQQHPPGDNA